MAPTINLARISIPRNEEEFRKVLEQLKPSYQIALRIKTSEEITKEIARRDKERNEEKIKKFSEFVQSLKEKGIKGKDYRDAVEQWRKDNP